MSVAERLKQIQIRMQSAAVRAGRDPSQIRLLAVSKLHTVAKINEAFAAGQVSFAENYVQEARSKQEQLIHMNLDWHFIGRIQSNKAKLLAGHFSLIHSVDRMSVLEVLHHYSLQSPQNILLQFNVADEASKGGAGAQDLAEMVNLVVQSSQSGVRLCGLMVMPPLTEDAERVRPFFRHAREKLAQLRDGLSKSARSIHPLNELSMGTSQDFEVAIEEGATWIRIGTEIFGPREVQI